MKPTFINQWPIVFGTFVLTLIFILWEHFNGGVIEHYLLADENMPSLSNWWGLLTIPVFTYVCTSLIKRRHQKKIKSGDISQNFEINIVKRFFYALIFGVFASLLWEFDMEEILQYFILSPVLIAFFKRIYLPEYTLGFVLGMMFTFGGILPILFAIVLLILCFIAYQIKRGIVGVFKKRN
ncbi:hypothetical protein Q2T40_17915 [Winogradskyella maritima]|uniref:Tripartite tricarboxylate transporter TctB family protein n=1 Tax=Winogradskyella maritima TaxID=1517766 RepID=A0ABV8AHL9_9FLAO|nr:hypothetical protein [Winogradskyella maritima]